MIDECAYTSEPSAVSVEASRTEPRVGQVWRKKWTAEEWRLTFICSGLYQMERYESHGKGATMSYHTVQLPFLLDHFEFVREAER